MIYAHLLLITVRCDHCIASHNFPKQPVIRASPCCLSQHILEYFLGDDRNVCKKINVEKQEKKCLYGRIIHTIGHHKWVLLWGDVLSWNKHHCVEIFHSSGLTVKTKLLSFFRLQEVGKERHDKQYRYQGQEYADKGSKFPSSTKSHPTLEHYVTPQQDNPSDLSDKVNKSNVDQIRLPDTRKSMKLLYLYCTVYLVITYVRTHVREKQCQKKNWAPSMVPCTREWGTRIGW